MSNAASIAAKPADQMDSARFPASLSAITIKDEHIIRPVAHREVFSVHAHDDLLAAKSGFCFRAALKVKRIEMDAERDNENITLTFRAAGQETVSVKLDAVRFLKASIAPKRMTSGADNYTDAANILRHAADTKGIGMSIGTANNVAYLLHYRYG